jgi:hypothetical protein
MEKKWEDWLEREKKAIEDQACIKVSELKEFTKETMSCGDMASATDLAYCEGYNAALKDLLARFCKGASHD